MDPDQERLIRDAYAAFMRGDLDATVAAFTPDATLTNPEYAVEGGVRVGRDQVRAGLQSLHDDFEYAALEVEEILSGPNGILVVLRFEARGKVSGAPVNDRFAHVFRMRGLEVLDFAWFRSLEEGRAAVGL